MKLNKSRNLKILKDEIGQANHYLITVLVGLDGIIEGVVDIKESFSTTWNPKDKKASAERSRVYAKKSALTWIVDNLDMYLRMCNEEPKLIQDSSLQSKFDSNGRSVYRKYEIISDYLGISNIESAMVDLLICWRNRLVHYKAENNISDTSRNLLVDNMDEIEANYNGLDVNRMLKSFDNSAVPSFKEVASMIKSSIKYVHTIDEKLISLLNTVIYADRVLITYIKDDYDKRLNNIFSKDKKTRLRTLKNILFNYGFNNNENKDLDEFILNIASLDYNSASAKLTNNSFV